jgi:hypothetical protein
MNGDAGDRALLRHFLAALAYRTQKALRDAPATIPASPPATRRARPSRSSAT